MIKVKCKRILRMEKLPVFNQKMEKKFHLFVCLSGRVCFADRKDQESLCLT